MNLVTIIFGSGWWIAWHLFIVGSIVPMLVLLRWLRKAEPGTEPQRRERVHFALLGVAFALAFATVADGAMLGWKLGELRGAGWGTIFALAFCMLWTLLLFGVAKKLSVPKEDEETTMLPATVAFALWHAGIVVANLMALHRIHG